jgi:Domain of unknown function (DUF4824)
MRPILSRTRLFVLGFALILIANVIALLGVVANRSGKPEAVIELTERELGLPHYEMNDENSGLALHLNWRILPEIKDDIYPYYSRWGSPAWFNAQKLTELGFIIDKTTCPDGDSKRKEPLPKDGFIVLEYDGDAYQEALQRAEMFLEKAEAALKANEKDKDLQDRFKNANKNLEAERTSESRLFPIDAGLDAGKLRERYPDRSKFIIMRGIVGLECRYKNKKEAVGHIADIRIDKINVPLSYRKLFDSIEAQDKSEKRGQRSPRYKVQVTYGSRFEPWVQRIDELLK